MTHARRGHECRLCGRVVFGNGGEVSHGRAHVRRGDAVELLKDYPVWPPMSVRMFLPVSDERWIAKQVESGFQVIGGHA